MARSDGRARSQEGKLLPLPVIGALRDYRDRLSRLQPNGLEVQRATGSRLEWFVGALADIFERHFQIKPTAGRSSRNIDRNGVERALSCRQPFHRLRYRRLQGSRHPLDQCPVLLPTS